MWYRVRVNPEEVKAGVAACTVTEICELGERSIWCSVGDLIITAATKHAKESWPRGFHKRPFRIARREPKEDRFCPYVRY